MENPPLSVPGKAPTRWIRPVLGILPILLGCSPEHFGKAANGFRTVGLGMTRSQVQERLRADSSFRPAPGTPSSQSLSAFTTLGGYESFLRFDFDPSGRLAAIRISVGEVGRHYVDDQAIPYFYNCLRTLYGEPQAAWDTYDNLDIYLWDLPEVRRTLASIHYWVPTGRFLLVYITDPKKPSPEEAALRKYAGTGRKFRHLNKPPEPQTVLSGDF